MRKDFTYPSSDGKNNIHGIIWRSYEERKPEGILQIVHGMSEYVGRYEGLAEFLVDHGYIVAGNDHLGHGESVSGKEDFGYFGENGNAHLISDIHALRCRLQLEYPGVPYFMLGHSMGSFLIRQYIAASDEGEDITYSHGLAGTIIMGTCWQPGAALAFGKTVCRLQSVFKGWRGKSGLVNAFSFGSYLKRISGAVSKMDWLSSNHNNVEKYIADPRCGFSFTLNGYYNMFTAIQKAQNINRMRMIDSDMALLFLAGTEDPVGGYGEQVRKTFVKYKENTGCICDIKLYDGDRHEILNEDDKDEVYGDILAWMRRE